MALPEYSKFVWHIEPDEANMSIRIGGTPTSVNQELQYRGINQMKDSKSAWLGISLLGATLATLSIGTNSYAQSPAADDEVLEEIVVRAQRRETNLLRTALAATVLTGEELIDKGVSSLISIQYAVPSLHISDYGSANVFNIRGIGRSKVDIEIPSGVQIYADGVPTLVGYFQNEPYFDMASIEVLRGPQGTVAGKSASGGAIFLNTRSPELGETGGNFEVGGGEHELYEARGAINISASETVAFRAAFNYENRDHYYDAITGPYTGHPGERDLKSVRLGLLVSPNDQLDILLKVGVSDLDFGGNITGSFGDNLFVVEQDAPFTYTDESSRSVLDIDYTFDNGVRFSSLTGYQQGDTVNNLDSNGTLPTPNFFKSAGNIELLAQEFNLVSPDDQRLRWVLGAFYSDQTIELLPMDQDGFTFYGNDFLPTDAPWAGSPWLKEEDDWAVFGHIIYDLSDSLELEFGVRYSDYEMLQLTDWRTCFVPLDPFVDPFFDLSTCFDGMLPTDGTWFATKPPGPDTQTLAEDSVDWKIGLNYSPNDTHFVYGVISRGHTTGSVNIFPPFDPYSEMEVLNFDAGWKAVWADGRVRTQIAAYYENVEGYQAAFADQDIENSAGQVQNSISDSKIYGIEFTGEVTSEHVGVDFGVSFNESELGTFDNVAHPITSEILDLTGSKFPFAPDYSLNVGFEVRGNIGSSTYVSARADVSHISETQGELFPDPEFTIPSRTLVNLMFRMEWGDWYGYLWVTNAADKHYIGAIQNTGTLYYPGPPRQGGIRIGRNF
jgi:iron complex outermembrane receptor protein